MKNGENERNREKEEERERERGRERKRGRKRLEENQREKWTFRQTFLPMKEKKITSENIFTENSTEKLQKNGEAFQFEDVFTITIGQKNK